MLWDPVLLNLAKLCHNLRPKVSEQALFTRVHRYGYISKLFRKKQLLSSWLLYKSQNILVINAQMALDYVKIFLTVIEVLEDHH